MLVIVCRYGSSWSSTSFVTVQSWCLGSVTARGLQSPTLHSTGTRQLVLSCRKSLVSNKRFLCNTAPTAIGFQLHRPLQVEAFRTSVCLSPCICFCVLNCSSVFVTSTKPTYDFLLDSLRRIILNRGPLVDIWHS